MAGVRVSQQVAKPIPCVLKALSASVPAAAAPKLDVLAFAYRMMNFDGRNVDSEQALAEIEYVPDYHDVSSPNRQHLVRGVQAALRELGYGTPNTGVVDAATGDLLAKLVSPTWRAMTWHKIYAALADRVQGRTFLAEPTQDLLPKEPADFGFWALVIGGGALVVWALR